MRRKRFYQRPGFRRFVTLAAGIALYLWLSSLLEEPLPTLVVVGHILMAAFGLLLAVALSSQFILPVRSSSERLAAFWRVLAYWLGMRGPVMVIQNGRVIEAPGERERTGSGVLLIDHIGRPENDNTASVDTLCYQLLRRPFTFLIGILGITFGILINPFGFGSAYHPRTA